MKKIFWLGLGALLFAFGVVLLYSVGQGLPEGIKLSDISALEYPQLLVVVFSVSIGSLIMAKGLSTN